MATYTDKNGNDATAEKTAIRDARIGNNEVARRTRMLFAQNCADVQGSNIHQKVAAFYDNAYSVTNLEAGSQAPKPSFLSKVGLGRK